MVNERESTGIKLEQLSSEEIYTRIKKKGEWIIEKNKPDSQFILERFGADGETPWKETDEEKEENFDIFFADADGNQKLFKNNFWFNFVELSEDEKKLSLHASIPAEEKEKIINNITEKMGPDFLNQLKSLARERFHLNQAKKYDEVDKVNETFEPLLEQAYLILREAGTKPGDIRR